MKIVAIIQARMGSTRLPGKVLRQVLGKPLLAYQLERVRLAKHIDEIIIATTTQPTDDPIITFCQKEDVLFSRGSEQDVLSRYYDTAIQANADVIVRLTSDCPLIDPAVIDKVIETYTLSNHYVSNVVRRTYPRGMDVEVFSIELLKQINEEATSKKDREHVTTFVREQPDRFKIKDVVHRSDYSNYRLTVDTAEDLMLIEKILEKIYPVSPAFTLEDIISLLQKHQDWLKINAHIEQKR
ncbi:cytidylyltransferase domain-containing protein [Gracilibacillus xinjiangensis]|uniref:Cytidylyltransferase domain-containing protein n=1 Tax=Gracilibacillus xinjiangensis TaxID=1193282 RepID=A0ABV8X0H5_9BACI